MTWLRHRVPLSLLADLLDPAGPRSREILTAEAVASDVHRSQLLAELAEAAWVRHEAVKDFAVPDTA